ncbi:MAG: hypothetical protein R3B92_04110 [Patescibacteria group bacterium]
MNHWKKAPLEELEVHTQPYLKTQTAETWGNHAATKAEAEEPQEIQKNYETCLPMHVGTLIHMLIEQKVGARDAKTPPMPDFQAHLREMAPNVLAEIEALTSKCAQDIGANVPNGYDAGICLAEIPFVQGATHIQMLEEGLADASIQQMLEEMNYPDAPTLLKMLLVEPEFYIEVNLGGTVERLTIADIIEVATNPEYYDTDETTAKLLKMLAVGASYYYLDNEALIREDWYSYFAPRKRIVTASARLDLLRLHPKEGDENAKYLIEAFKDAIKGNFFGYKRMQALMDLHTTDDEQDFIIDILIEFLQAAMEGRIAVSLVEIKNSLIKDGYPESMALEHGEKDMAHTLFAIYQSIVAIIAQGSTTEAQRYKAINNQIVRFSQLSDTNPLLKKLAREPNVFSLLKPPHSHCLVHTQWPIIQYKWHFSGDNLENMGARITYSIDPNEERPTPNTIITSLNASRLRKQVVEATTRYN